MNLKMKMTSLRHILVCTQISSIPIPCWEQVGTLRPPEALAGFKERLSEIINYGRIETQRQFNVVFFVRNIIND